jgi:gas vesicle protein
LHERVFARYGQDYVPLLIEQIETEYQGRGERFIEALPGIFVLVGLLFTFIGLGLAVGEAGHALIGASGGEANANLTRALSLVGVKFKTSVWGIISNILFRAVTGIIIQEKQHKAFQNIIEKSKKRADATNSDKYRKFDSIVDYVKNFSDVADSLKYISEQMTNNLNMNMEYLANIIGKDLNGIVNKLQETTGGLTDNVIGMREVLENIPIAIGTNLENSTKTISEATDKVRESAENSSKELNESMIVMSKKIGIGLANAGKSIAVATDGIIKSSEISAKNLEETMKTISEKIESGLDKAGNSISIATEHIANKAEASSNSLENATNNMSIEFKQGMKSLDGHISNIEKLTQKITNIYGNLDRTLSKLSVSLDKSNEWNEKLVSIVAEQKISEGSKNAGINLDK